VRIVWMMVSKDKFELPEAIADSAGELARIVGISEDTIYSTVSHMKAGRLKSGRFRRVEIEEDDDEQN